MSHQADDAQEQQKPVSSNHR